MKKVVTCIYKTILGSLLAYLLCLSACKPEPHVAPYLAQDFTNDTVGVHIMDLRLRYATRSLPAFALPVLVNGKFLFNIPGVYNPSGYYPNPDSAVIRDTFHTTQSSLSLWLLNPLDNNIVPPAADTFRLTVPHGTGKQFFLYTFLRDSLLTVPPRGGGEWVSAILESQLEPPAIGNFRIRLGHFARFSQAGNLLINGPSGFPTYSLLFADGSLVPGQEHIHYGNFAHYAELPYGVYSFRIRDDFTGKEIPYFSTNVVANNKLKAAPSAPLTQAGQTQFLYEDGGTYTILTSSLREQSKGSPLPNCTGCQSFQYFSEYGDQFKDPYSSTAKARNVAQVTYLNAATDGGAFTSPIASGSLALGEATSILLTNPGTLAVNFQGKDSTAQRNYTLNRLNNWLVAAVNKPGYPGLLVFPTAFPNDTLPYNSTITAPQTGGNNPNLYIRFLNLSPDAGPVAFVSRKNLNGNVLEEVIDPVLAGNVSFAQILTRFPSVSTDEPSQYTRISFADPTNIPTHIGVRQPGVDLLTPGALVPTQEIDYPFVTNPNQFNPAGVYAGPPGLPGVYTIALVGSIHPNAPAAQRARLIVVKHSR